MDITHATTENAATAVGVLVDNARQQQPPVAKSEEQPDEKQPSTEVKLSVQAQQLSRSGADSKPTVTPPPPSTQPVTSERKGGQINTLA